MANDLQVYVIDDDDAARDSLVFLLESAGLAVASYESAKAFLDAIPALDRGCVITDVRMPEIDGVELVRLLTDINIDWPVIVITGHADVGLAVEAMRRGAVDFIEKPYDDDVLLGAVRTALRNRSDAARDAESAAAQTRMAALSALERQVLDGLVAGRSNKAIASELGISERAVEIHRANVMTKTLATSLFGLIRTALIATR